MRKICVNEFLRVSRPFQANREGVGASHNVPHPCTSASNHVKQETLTKRKRSVHLTSLLRLVQISSFYFKNIFTLITKSYLNVEVNCTEPSPLAIVPSMKQSVENVIKTI